MQNFRQRVETELRSNILPFWLKHAVDEQYGGFRGQMSNDLTIDPLAPKGLILNARILWTFSKAFSVYREEAYLQMARRAYDYITRHFWDTESSGVFWMVDYLGRPVETKKRIYGQAFTVYSLVEYHGATGDEDAFAKALQIYEAIESASYDALHRGHFETYERDWTLADDQRLSEVDMDAKKSMNTHLHLLEAYANLLRCQDNPRLRSRLKELIQVFLEHIIDRESHHFRTFFDDEWHSQSDHISFGHDIEGTWLLCGAAEVLGDESILQAVREEALLMAQAVLDQAVDSDGGLLYEADASGIIDTDKHWWPQAEAVVGFLNAYQLSGRREFYVAAGRTWKFIEKCIVDRQYGEWFWKVSREGVPSQDKFKVDPWKCPYHNSRTCFEVMARLDNLGRLHGSPA
ncbi:MAG: AGE family epimerase/isomerase [Terriglobia bacterium]